MKGIINNVEFFYILFCLVPEGEQRSWFLAVGLADNTVRIISLDPAVSIIQIFDIRLIIKRNRTQI
jgi:hypothetical protein